MTLTTIKRDGLDGEALDIVFTIGASGTDHYTFQGEGLNGTVNDPTLYLTRGKTYRFENGTGAHPIRIQSTSGASGTAYNTGVTNNAGSGTVIVEVQHDAPDVLYYQCTSHANMNGILYITGAVAPGSITTAKLADSTGTSDGVTTAKLATDAVTAAKLADNAVVNASVDASADIAGSKLADNSISLAKLEHGTGSNDGKFLRANNGADPTFESLPTTGASQADLDDLTNSVALLGFKIAVNGSLARFQLTNQVIDEFNDGSGIDASASTNEVRNTANKYWVGASANFPTGGTVSTYTSGSTNYRYHSFTSTGTTNFVVNNSGTIDMLIVGGGGGGGGDTGGGGGGGEVFFIQSKPITAATYVVSVGAGGSGGSNTGDGSQGTGSYFGSDYATTNLYARPGGGGAGQNGTANDAPGVASTDITGTGNGGGGSVAPGVSNGTPFDATDRTETAPSGQTFTLSGGTRGGVSEYQSYNMAGGGGGAGGNGQSYMTGGSGVQVDIDGNNYYWGGGGGGGVSTRPVSSWGPGGTGGGGAGAAGNYGVAGGGSALNAGGSTVGSYHGGDGGANTGGGGGGASDGNYNGGDGGSGIVIVRYSADDFQDNVDLTLQSIDATASTAPTKADFVMLYEDGAGTATLNTDIKAFISRDSGTTFTQGTLVAEGDYGSGKKIVAFHDLDISGQPSGTSVCYKVTTHNQGSGKQTRIHAVSHGWA